MILLIYASENINMDYRNAGESLGIAYLASYMESKGYKVEVADSGISHIVYDELFHKAIEMRYPIVGFSTTTANYAMVKSIASRLRKLGYEGHVTYGGHFSSLAYKEIFDEDTAVDSIIFGEGEITLHELTKAVIEKNGFENIAGLAYLDENRKIIKNLYRERVESLNNLPFPKRFDFKREHVRVSSSRGCYGTCSYCSIETFYGSSEIKHWISRSVENTLLEIDMLVNKLGAKHIVFVDDNFIGPGIKGKKRAEEIAARLIEENYNIEFDIECRANDIDYDLFSLLKNAGLRQVFVGIESGNAEDLLLYKKGISVEQNLLACKVLNELEIDAAAGFIMINPYTKITKISENLKFLRKMAAYNCVSPRCILSFMSIMPGYSLYNQLQAEKRLHWVKNPHQYDYFIIEKDAAMYSLLATKYYPEVAYKAYDSLRKLKMEISLKLKCTSEIYRQAKQLEVELFKKELDFADDILLMVKTGDLIALKETVMEFKTFSESIYKKTSLMQKLMELKVKGLFEADRYQTKESAF